MLLLGNMTNTFEATNFMSSFKVHNCYLQKILFDLQYVQINLIKSLYNRVLCLACSHVNLVVACACVWGESGSCIVPRVTLYLLSKLGT